MKGLTSIHKRSRNNHIPKIDLMRKIALMLKEEGLDVNHFASAVRLKRVLDRKGSPKEELESLIEDRSVHSFQLEMDTKKFLSETGETLQTTFDLEISISDVLVKIVK